MIDHLLTMLKFILMMNGTVYVVIGMVGGALQFFNIWQSSSNSIEFQILGFVMIILSVLIGMK